MRWKFVKLAVILCFLAMAVPALLVEKPSEARFSAVLEAVTADMDTHLYPKQDAAGVRDYLNLRPDQYTQIAFYRSDDRMMPEELVLVKFEPDQQADLEKAFRQRIQSQKDIYKGRLEKEEKTAANAILSIHPNYMLYVAGKDGPAMEQAFEEAL